MNGFLPATGAYPMDNSKRTGSAGNVKDTGREMNSGSEEGIMTTWGPAMDPDHNRGPGGPHDGRDSRDHDRGHGEDGHGR
jgi:hypothetical protein